MQRNKKSRSQMAVEYVPAPNKMMEDHSEEIEHMDFENKEPAHQDAALKMIMSSREAAWKRETESMKCAESERLKEELTMQDNPRREQVEKEAGFNGIKELETLLKVTKEKWVSKHHEMEDAIIQKDQVISSLEDSNQELKAKLKAIQTKIFQNNTEWETKVDVLEDNLSREQAEKEASLMKIKELEKLVEVTEEKCVTKHEAQIVQKDEMIASFSRTNTVLADSNLKLISMMQAMQNMIVQNNTEWETKVNVLEDNLSREQAEKEASSMKIMELEKLVEVTEEKWVTKNEAITVQAAQMIASVTRKNMALEDNNRELISMLKAIQSKIVQNNTEWETKVNVLEDSLSREQAEKEASSMKIMELEELVEVTEEKWVTKYEAKIIQTAQMIASVTRKKMALEDNNRELISMLKAIQSKIVQNNTEWETKVNVLEDSLSREQAEKEASSMKIKELEELVEVTEEKWVSKSHEMEDAIIQKDHVISSLEDSNKGLKVKLQAIQTKIFQNNTERESKVDILEDNLSREQAEKEASSMKIKELEKLVEVTEEKWVTKYEAQISQTAQMIASVTRKKMALEDNNRELISMLKAIQSKIVQTNTEWETKVNVLEDSLSREQAEKEASSMKIKELEELVEVTEEKWVSKSHEMEDAIIQKDHVISSLEDSNEGLKVKLQAIQTKIFQNNTERESKVDILEDNLSREQAEKEASSMKIKELEKLVEVTEEKWVTKYEAQISQMAQMIASVTRKKMALEDNNRELISMLKAIQSKIVQTNTEWETKVNVLEDSLSREQAEKEASCMKIKELENLVSNTKQMWAAKNKAVIELLILRSGEVQELP
ncbi:uncharacterized protein [Paralichthys olivaceus]|uniref:uncharacterized protein n=1 Tax=Paralichthys olivaceus TaxID=8255 RepID=UPI003751DEC9